MARTQKPADEFDDDSASFVMTPPTEANDAELDDAFEAFIQYTGGATIRQVTRAEWEKAGVPRQGDVQWTVQNRHLVPISELTDTAVKRLATEENFRFVTADQVS
jgi:hypothetical protein